MAAIINTNGSNGAKGASGNLTKAFEYEYEMPHLDESEALARYAREKSRHPNAIVTLEHRDCGHYDVCVHESESEKQVFYRIRLNRLFEDLWSAFK